MDKDKKEFVLDKSKIEAILLASFELRVEAILILDADGQEVETVAHNCDISIGFKERVKDKRCEVIAKFLAHLLNMTLDAPVSGEGNPHVEHFPDYKATAMAFHVVAIPPQLKTFVMESQIVFCATTVILAETIEEATELGDCPTYVEDAYYEIRDQASDGFKARDIDWSEVRELDPDEEEMFDWTDSTRNGILGYGTLD